MTIHSIHTPVVERRRWGWPELTDKLTPAPVVHESHFRLWIYRAYDIGTGYDVYRESLDYRGQPIGRPPLGLHTQAQVHGRAALPERADTEVGPARACLEQARASMYRET